MTLEEIRNAANAITDENTTAVLTEQFVNEAIANINIELGATLPVIDTITDYVALSDNFIRVVIVPFVSYCIKSNDGSLTEARDFFSRYQRGVQLLARVMDDAIPAAYQDENFGGAYVIDTVNAINVGWFTDGDNDDVDW